MKALPCPFCGSDKTEFHSSGADPILGERYILCTKCRATGPLAQDDGEANLKWQALIVEGRLEEIENGIGKELAAYQALSGGKTAMEYALYANDIDKVRAQVAECVRKAQKFTDFPNQAPMFYQDFLLELEKSLEIDQQRSKDV